MASHQATAGASWFRSAETVVIRPIDESSSLRERLTAVAPALCVAVGDRSAAELFGAMVRAFRASGESQQLWLLVTALAGAMPSPDEMVAATRALDQPELHRAERDLLDIVYERAALGSPQYPLDIVQNSILVDVDFCARHDFQTGIQRVVRQTVPRWAARHEVVPVAWTDSFTALRQLYPYEVPNVMDYRPNRRTVLDQDAVDRTRLVIPLDCTVVLADVPADVEVSDAYTAIARWTNNRIVAVGYDMIPVVSADMRPGTEATRFVRYLSTLKHADAIAAISRSAASEFAGFAQAMPSQGLRGPRVEEIALPASPPDPALIDGPAAVARSGRPTVVVVGTHEPHKNHAAVVNAAERLWRDHVDFELVFAGGVGHRGPENLCFREAERAGRPVRFLGRVSDEELTQTLRDATFSVFLSLHEGYGLPVAESLACGTPVVTSSFGSLQEIAEGGGCVTVDPRDDDAVTGAMRDLLTHPERITELRSEIAKRPQRSWDEYADELWSLVTAVGS